MRTSAPSVTLRNVMGLNNQLPRLSESTLIMIDFQNTYRAGVMTLDGAESALTAGARLLERARTIGTPVIHIINDGGENTPYDIKAEIGRISDKVAPRDGETVVVKQFPNSFHATALEETLKGLGKPAGSNLILAGFMTQMCVMFTAQGAFNLGYHPTVVAEATATRSLSSPNGQVLSADNLQNASLAIITDLFGPVALTVDALAS
ncbi:cysteine hydrolase family protein [Rhodococcus qingshengii]|uniref:cysteine hydrolase family protein n=1 Tax=Rhodococcus qingshengii TaxID=334542 RepID=UPI001AE0C0A0|nr:cysteine hydrolase family protein [Rhodococcus qingshengii]